MGAMNNGGSQAVLVSAEATLEQKIDAVAVVAGWCMDTGAGRDAALELLDALGLKTMPLVVKALARPIAS